MPRSSFVGSSQLIHGLARRLAAVAARSLLPFVCFSLGVASADVQAQTVVSFNSITGGNWADGTLWTGGVPATGTNQIASFVLNIGNANAVVTLTDDRTIAGLRFDDTSAPANQEGSWILNGPNVLTLSSAAGTPTITVTNSIATDDVTINAALAGVDGFTKLGAGRLVLTNNANTLAGTVTIAAGTLRSTAAPVAQVNLNLAGGTYESSGTLARNLGTGAGEIQYTGNSGIGAFGGQLDVQFNGGSQLIWGSTVGFLGAAQPLILSSAQSNNLVDFQNSLDLNGAVRTIQTVNGTALVDARISGNLVNGSGSLAGLIVAGTGALELSGVNTYDGRTSVVAGVLIAQGTALSAASQVTLSGGLLASSGAFTRIVGSGIGQISFTGSTAGLIARGGQLNVNLGNGTALTWGTVDFNPATLVVTDAVSTDTLEFQNAIDLGAGTRTISAPANSPSTVDARFSGVLSGGANLVFSGTTGTIIELTAANTYTGATTVVNGSLYLTGDALTAFNTTADGNLSLSNSFLYASGTLNRTIGTGAGQIQIVGTAANQGFVATDADLLLQFGNLQWGSGGFLNSTSTFALQLNAGNALANAAVVLEANVDLNTSGTRAIAVGDNTASNNDLARITGSIYSSIAGGTLVKQGAGLLELTGTGSTAALRLDAGTVRAAQAALTSSNITFSSGTLESSGVINRSIGGGAGQLRTTTTGALVAVGGDLAIGLSGTATETFSLVLGSATSTNRVDLLNTSLDLGGFTGTVSIADQAAAVDTIVTGTFSNGTLVKLGTGLLEFQTPGNTANLQVGGGSVRASESALTSGNIALASNAASLESNGTLSRTVGTGAGQIQWVNSSGFAAVGGDLAVSLNGGGAITWADTIGSFNLLLGNSNSTHRVDLQNSSIDLGGGIRTINVGNATGVSVEARLTGTQSNGTLTKAGAGTLEVTGVGSSANWAITAGALRVLPSAITSGSIALSGVGVIESSGTLQLNLGLTANNSIRFAGSGGYAAVGGDLNVQLDTNANFGTIDTLTWGNDAAATTTGFLITGQALTFGSLNADHRVTFANNITSANGGQTREFRVIDNPNSTADAAVFTGNLGGSVSYSKTGDGLLILTGSNASTNRFDINAGTLQIGDGGSTGQIGAATLTVNNNSLLQFNRNNLLTVANVINGTGSVRQIGSGTTVLGGANTYTGATTISNGTLQVGNGATGGSLVSATIANNGALVFSRSNASSYNGQISGTGSVTVTGGGTFTLNGTHDFAGPTSVLAGTLDLAGTLANSAVTVASGGTLSGGGTVIVTVDSQGSINPGAIGGAGTLTLGGLILSGGSLNFDLGTIGLGNSDRLILTGGAAPVVSAVTNLIVSNLGTLGLGTYDLITGYNGTIANLNNLALATRSGAFTLGLVNQSGALQLNVTQSLGGPFDLTWTGLQSNVWDTTITNWTGSDIGYVNGDHVTFNDSSAVTSVTVGTPVTPGSVNVDTTGTYTFFGNTISGTATLLKQGAGTLAFANDVSFGGGATIQAGTLQIGVGGTNGTFAGNIVNNGVLVINRTGALNLGSDIGGTGSLQITGGVTTTFNGALTYVGDTTIANAAVRLSSTSAAGFTANNTGNLTLTAGTGGTSFLTLAGTINRTVGTGAGQIRLGGSGGTVGFSATDADLSLQLGNATWGSADFLPDETVTLALSSTTATALTELAGNIDLSGATTRTISVADNTGSTADRARINGNVTSVSGGTLVKTGAGVLEITGNGSTANWSIGGGMIRAAASAVTTGSILLTGGNVLESSGTLVKSIGVADGQLRFSGSGGFAAFGSPLSVQLETNANPSSIDTLAWGNSAAQSTTGFLIGAAGVLVLGSSNANDAVTLLNPISLVANIAHVINVVDNPNSSSDKAVVSGVISGVAGSAAMQLHKTGNGLLVLTGANTFAATGGFRINGGTVQVGDGGTIGTIAASTVPVTIAAGATLQYNRSDTPTVANVIGGAGALAQIGTGTLVLSGNSTYTGATTVSAGTLQVTGTLGNTAVAIASGATLLGTGTLGGTVSNSGTLAGGLTIAGAVTSNVGGAISPGTLGTVGTLTLGSLVLGGGSLNFDLGATGAGNSDFLAILGGSFNVTGATTLTFNALGGFGLGTYDLVGGYTGAISGLNLLSTPSLFNSFSLSLTDNGGILQLLVTESGGPPIGPQTLTWTGANDALWNTTSANWTGSASLYTEGDNVTFNDTSSVKTLTIASPVAPGSIVVDVNTSYTFLGAAITGTTSLLKQGSGTLTLAGSHAFTGPTTVQGGVLQLGGDYASSIELSGALLQLSTTGNQTLTGLISGTGFLQKLGSGTTTLLGVNTFSGITSVDSGTLTVNHALSGTVFVNAGGSFTGTGASTSQIVVQGGSGSITGTHSGELDLSSGNVTIASGGVTTGAVDIGGGQLIVATGGQLGNTLGINVTGGTLNVQSGGAVVGNGQIQVGGILNANGDVQGTVTVNAGGVLQGNGSVGVINLHNGGTLSVGNSVGSLTIDGNNVSGGPALTLNVGSNIVFEFNNATGAPGTGWDYIELGSGLLTINATNQSANDHVLVHIDSLDLLNNHGAAANFNTAPGVVGSIQEYYWKFIGLNDLSQVVTTGPSSIGGRFQIIDDAFGAGVFDVADNNPFNRPSSSIGQGTFKVLSGDFGQGTGLYIYYSAVPEPGSMLLAGLGSLAAGWYRRRGMRRQSDTSAGNDVS